MSKKSKFPQKLLVEGKDDEHVIYALAVKFELPHNFEVIDCEGIDKLISQIPIRLKESDIQTLAIIVDADTNLLTRWQEIKKILKDVGYQLPNELPVEGLVISAEQLPKIGVWIMPNNQLNGILEDFIKFLVPSNDDLLLWADYMLNELEEKSLNQYKAKDRAKALIHTWLAWQEDPGTPLGLAITKKYLSVEPEICQRFINWLNQTFNS